MKTVLILLFFALTGYLPAQSQTVNGVPIKDLESEHILIVGTPVLLSPKLTIDLDFGQPDKAFITKDTEIRDENDRPVEFNSMVDALNFMSANGYEFVQAYTMMDTSQQSTVYYLLRRKVKEN